MKKKRHGGMLEENKNKNIPASPDTNKKSDVSDIKGLKKQTKGISNIFNLLGKQYVKVMAFVLLGIIKGIKFVGKELWILISSIGKAIMRLMRSISEPIRKRIKINENMHKKLRRAKKKGRKVYTRELIKCIGSYFFGEEGIFYTAFNYMLPIISAAFLIGVISYGSGLEYGICVEYNGKEIGIISAESDFDSAAKEVQQRIAYNDGDEMIDFSPRFSLRIISESDRFVNSSELADQMLAVSDQELTEAFGIYIDGEFIGAVKDKSPIESTLDNILVNYKTEGTVKDISFKNKIEYTQGIYLAESVMTETDAIELLTSTHKITSTYVAQKDDSPLLICLKYNMSIDEFQKLNPNLGDSIEEGKIINVTESESYLPVQYVREIEMLSFLDYDTIEVETSSLNLGTTEILVKGEKGERRSSVEVTYIDGVERARKIMASEITKQPVTEQIGIGTYTARPASTATMLYGTGEFGWPVDGGYISDPFLSDRNHKGLDIAADGGTDIYAAADGVVVSAGWNPGGYGYFVLIDHLNGYQTVYAHCSSLYASEGQTVSRGQLIAAVGTTGNSTGNHCHFEVRYLGVCYDPASYINTMADNQQ